MTLPATPTDDATTERLPVLALIGLFFSGLIGILTEALPAGLLPAIGRPDRPQRHLGGTDPAESSRHRPA